MSAPLLIELGCEELPAKSLVAQAKLLSNGLKKQLADAELLSVDTVRWLATPRRLAVIFEGVEERQPDRILERKGPAEKAAFDDDGNPTRAAAGFAKSVGREVAQLERLENDQGRWLYAEIEQPGQSLDALLGDMLKKVVQDMAGARSMRWSDRTDRFLRPVRWLLGLHGDRVVPFDLFGLSADNTTRGHRIHAPGEHIVASAGDYEQVLERAFVIADYERRRNRIVEQIHSRADADGLSTHDDPGLVDEVTGLVEWPVAVLGRFEEAFLDVPAEALISTMREHQKSFPLFDKSGQLAARFISVANIESRDEALMIHGFERVIRPRLADAKFFFRKDREQPLEGRFPRLEQMLFQEQLGSLADKSLRLEKLTTDLAPLFGADREIGARAARLCKCDLMTEMVGEFPELQGTMGRHYANADGEPQAVATAIESHYLPRHAGDDLPADAAGQALAIADRLDSLVGVFAAGKKPKGGKDPFALRRAALGVVRILDAARVDAGVSELIEKAASGLTEQIETTDSVLGELQRFIQDRLRAWMGERGISANTLNAVGELGQRPVHDFVARAEAVQVFADDPEVSSLIAANKRAANLLEQSGTDEIKDVDRRLMHLEAESALLDEVESAENVLEQRLGEADYPAALHRLAQMKTHLDRFFDDVMVMDDDIAQRHNRLALLARLRSLVLQVADVARLGRS